MKVLKKCSAVAIATLFALSLCAFINVDIGVDVKDENNKVKVFKEVLIDQSKIDQLDTETILKILVDVSNSGPISRPGI